MPLGLGCDSPRVLNSVGIRMLNAPKQPAASGSFQGSSQHKLNRAVLTGKNTQTSGSCKHC